MTFSCPHCGKRLFSGKSVGRGHLACEHCGERFAVGLEKFWLGLISRVRRAQKYKPVLAAKIKPTL